MHRAQLPDLRRGSVQRHWQRQQVARALQETDLRLARRKPYIKGEELERPAENSVNKGGRRAGLAVEVLCCRAKGEGPRDAAVTLASGSWPWGPASQGQEVGGHERWVPLPHCGLCAGAGDVGEQVHM